MNKKINILLIIIVTISLLVACSTTVEPETTPVESPTQTVADLGYGAIGAFSNESMTIEQMLNYALQDEYLARAEYDYIINEMDATTPFTNIIKAEEMHISLLIPLFETYGYTTPTDTSSSHLIIPTSLTQAYETGVQAEIDNIAMYEKFLQLDLPDDVREVFTELRDGSVSHLAAFQRKLTR